MTRVVALQDVGVGWNTDFETVCEDDQQLDGGGLLERQRLISRGGRRWIVGGETKSKPYEASANNSRRMSAHVE